jgi:hypothetical protein
MICLGKILNSFDEYIPMVSRFEEKCILTKSMDLESSEKYYDQCRVAYNI